VTFRHGLVVYAAAFVAMLAAAATAAVGSLGASESIRMMYASSTLSALAIVGSIAAVLLARR
jgi:hypothetical protein